MVPSTDLSGIFISLMKKIEQVQYIYLYTLNNYVYFYTFMAKTVVFNINYSCRVLCNLPRLKKKTAVYYQLMIQNLPKFRVFFIYPLIIRYSTNIQL